ncbi:MAG: hypothetical protein ACYTHN_24730, partial [Planctomycetota bacterium]
ATLAQAVREICESAGETERMSRLQALKSRMDAVSTSTLCAKEEIRWPGKGFHLFEIARAVLTGGTHFLR